MFGKTTFVLLFYCKHFWIFEIGATVTIEDFPYQVSLRYQGQAHVCGGSIIDENHVLTAAHCVFSRNAGFVLSPSLLTVAAGSTQITDVEAKNIQVEKIFVHEKFNPRTLLNDIAVLRIVGSFGNWTDTIQFIPINILPPSDGEVCNISGWGTIDIENLSLSRVLMFAAINISNHDCDFYNISNGRICAGDKDSCLTDGGGPLVCNGGLSGIASFKRNCKTSHDPGIFTDVSKYLKWIDEQLGSSSAEREVYNLVASLLFLTILSSM